MNEPGRVSRFLCNALGVGVLLYLGALFLFGQNCLPR